MRQYVLILALLVTNSAHSGGFLCRSPEPAPTCREIGQWVGTPEHLQSSAVFLTCNPETKYSGGNLPTCKNVAEAILDLDSGVTLNVIVQESLLKTDASLLEVVTSLKARAAAKSIPLNILATNSLPGDFARDSAVILRDGPTIAAAAMPDLMGGTRAMQEAISLCQDVELQYAHSRTIVSFFQNLRHRLYSRDHPRGNSPDVSLYVEGGNVLGLPGSSVAMGVTKHRQLPNYVENFFRGVVRIELPEEVGVGHIDEFFNIVPARKGQCGYAILAASPQALRNWALGPGALEPARWWNDDQNLTWSEVAESEGFPWQDHQRQIDAAKKTLWQNLSIPPGCTFEELFVDLPMGWDIQGRPYFSNPVNGLHLNGNYLFSEPYEILYDPASAAPLGKRKLGQYPLPALTKMLSSLLLAQTGLRKAVPIDTNYTDGLTFGTGGNLHCMTLQIPRTCTR